jgi:hypothetical protein
MEDPDDGFGGLEEDGFGGLPGFGGFEATGVDEVANESPPA